MKRNEKISLTRNMIKLITREFGNHVCEDLNPHCSNCQAQWTLGWLNDYLGNLEFEKRQELLTYKIKDR